MGATCGADGKAYIVINGAEPHVNSDAEVLANNADPLDVFCGAFLCNAHAVAPAMSCKVEDNASSTVVGEFL